MTRETILCDQPALAKISTTTVNQAEDLLFSLIFSAKNSSSEDVKTFIFVRLLSVALLLAVV